MAKPTLALRVSPEVYEEVFKIAEKRDVGMSEALDMLILELKKERDESKRTRSRAKRRAKRRVGEFKPEK